MFSRGKKLKGKLFMYIISQIMDFLKQFIVGPICPLPRSIRTVHLLRGNLDLSETFVQGMRSGSWGGGVRSMFWVEGSVQIHVQRDGSVHGREGGVQSGLTPSALASGIETGLQLVLPRCVCSAWGKG